MPFTEFCCRAGGNNLNAGSLDGGSTEPSLAAVLTVTGGDCTSSAASYTYPVGTATAEMVVGRWVSICTDGDTAPVSGGFTVGRISAVNTGTRVISLTTLGHFGSAQAAGTGNKTLRIGGAWAGPSGMVGFPFGLNVGALTDAAGNRPRVNIKSDQQYNMTASIAFTAANGSNALWQGYASTYGDLGKAVIDGGTTGASYVLFNNNNSNAHLTDIIFQNNGATGNANLVSFNTGGNATGILRRVVFAHSRGAGLDGTAMSVASILVECESYDCNQSNTANTAGIQVAAGVALIRCISHDHGDPSGTDTNRAGLRLLGQARMYGCIVDTCNGPGITNASNGQGNVLIGVDVFNCGNNGLLEANGGGAPSYYIESSNFVRNVGYGLKLDNAAVSTFIMANCGFGAGTQANTLGKYALSTTASQVDLVEISGEVVYPNDVTPWVDPDNGDFRINLAQAKNAGRGAFTQTASGYAGAVGYPDIGAAQHLDAGGAGGPVGRFISAQRGTPY